MGGLVWEEAGYGKRRAQTPSTQFAFYFPQPVTQNGKMKFSYFPFVVSALCLCAPAIAQDKGDPSSSEVDLAPIDVATRPPPHVAEQTAQANIAFGPNPMFDVWLPFSPADYPPDAYLQGQQGPVRYRVAVDTDGKATACEVTETSTYPLLDDATCPLIMRVADFEPAMDNSGNSIAAPYDGVVSWIIVEPKIQNMVLEVQYHVNEAGEIEDCKLISAAGEPPSSFTLDPCPKETGPYRDAQGRPVARNVRMKLSADVTEPAESVVE